MRRSGEKGRDMRKVKEKRLLFSRTMTVLLPFIAWGKKQVINRKKERENNYKKEHQPEARLRWKWILMPPNCKRLTKSFTVWEKSISISFIIVCIPNPDARAYSCHCTVPCRPANYPYLGPMAIEIMDWGSLLAHPSPISPPMPSTCSAFFIKMAPWPACTLCSC